MDRSFERGGDETIRRFCWVLGKATFQVDRDFAGGVMDGLVEQHVITMFTIFSLFTVDIVYLSNK